MHKPLTRRTNHVATLLLPKDDEDNQHGGKIN